MAARAIATNGLNAANRGVLPLTGGTLAGPLVGTSATFSGQLTASGNSASTAPAVSITGEFLSGGSATTNTPHVLIQPSSTASSGAWNTAGTAFGINAPSAVAGISLFDFQVNGSSHVAYLHSASSFTVGPAGGTGFWSFNARPAGAFVRSAAAIGWSSSGAANGTADTTMSRESAARIATQSTLALIRTTAISAMAGGVSGAGLMMTSQSTPFGIFPGQGAPSLSAAQGSLYLRSDGSSTTSRAYIAINSTGVASAWTALTTGA